MNIRELQYLVAIAEKGHFGMAADVCFVSQPALSMQIKKLECTLGVQLIERTNKSARLTDIGKVITEQAKDILCRVDALKQTAKQAQDPYCGELHLGVIPTLAPYLLPHVMPGLSNLFPKLTIYLVEEQTSHLITKLNQGKLDGALLSLPLVDDALMSYPLFKEEFLLAISARHHLAKRKRIKMTELENQALLLLEDGHCMRDSALKVCYAAGASEAKEFRATSLETLRYMVAANAGMTLMPKLACQPNDGICYLPFSQSKPLRTIGMVLRPSSAKKILLQAVSDHIREEMAQKEIIAVI